MGPNKVYAGPEYFSDEMLLTLMSYMDMTSSGKMCLTTVGFTLVTVIRIAWALRSTAFCLSICAYWLIFELFYLNLNYMTSIDDLSPHGRQRVAIIARAGFVLF